MDEIKIGSFFVGKEHPPLIVAELSGNHQGSLKKAIEIIDAAKKAGAHAIKLQTYTPDTITLDVKREEFVIKDPDNLWKDRHLYDLYQEAHTPWEWHETIFKHCREIGIEVFSSPFDETAVDFLEELNVPCYKIASAEIIDLPLIRKAAKTGKPLIISTGAATFAEIEEGVEAARSEGCSQMILLKCTAAYPAPPKDVNLRTLPHLAASFDTLVGLSDHTLGIGVAIASIPYGACLIEKHFTLSRHEGGVDSPFSLEPEELRLLVTESKRAWEALGSVCYIPAESEKLVRSLRPSLYFMEDLKKGTIIKPQHVRTVRPGKGLLPKEISRILGLPLAKNIQKGTPVSWDHFNELKGED